MQQYAVAQRVARMEAACQGLEDSQQQAERNLRKTTVSIEELRELFKETDRMQKENARRMLETDRRMKETDRRLNEVGKQIGGLGERFGSFTEGMAFPSLKKILQERFGMQVVAPNVCARKNGRHLEPDVLAFSQTGETAGKIFVVEVKCHLREEGIQQLLRMLAQFFDFFPHFRGKQLFGILAAIQIPEDLRRHVLSHGLYLAQLRDEVFEIQVPEGFQPRVFTAEPARGDS